MKKISLKQQAYQAIRQKIINCEFPPGTLLNETLLLETIPGSRTPVRDALSRLEQEKLITILPKKGVLVSNLTSKDLRAIYTTRSLLEPYAVLHHANKIAEERFAYFYKKFSCAQPENSPSLYYRLDDEFHMTFIEATENPFLIQVYEQLRAQIHRARVLTGNITSERLHHSHSEHLDILIQCLKRNWQKASLRMKEHLGLSQSSVLKELSL